MSGRSKREWWYEVTDVWGFHDKTPYVHVGTVTIDRYDRSTVNITNLKTLEPVGGWAQKRLGERAGEWVDGPNPEWLSPLAKVSALAPDHPEAIEARRVLGVESEGRKTA